MSHATLTPAEQLRADLELIGPAAFTAADYKPGVIRHVVALRFAPDVGEAQKAEASTRFLALQSTPRSGNPYILSIETGRQDSGEGVDQQFEQIYIVSFKSEGDRNFYVGQPIVGTPHFYDSAHHAFKVWVGPLLHPQQPGVLVVDFKVASCAGQQS
jgi:hypothetical protein